LVVKIGRYKNLTYQCRVPGITTTFGPNQIKRFKRDFIAIKTTSTSTTCEDNMIMFKCETNNAIFEDRHTKSNNIQSTSIIVLKTKRSLKAQN
jgi:hypothetical protein